jgi:outer membrane receptor protein involved in Fe transport
LPGDVAVTGGSSGAPVASPYEPETLTSLEIGSKNRYLDNHLQLNGDIFYYRYGGHQVSVQVGSGPGGVPFFATLGSDARMMGAELESLFQLTPADRLGLTLSYTDGWYVDKPALFAAGVANSHLSGIPPWSINPTYCHTFDLLAGQTLTVLSGALFRSGYLITDLTQGDAAAGVEPYFRNGNTVTGNVTVTWNPKSQLSVSAYVRNIADERYKTSIVPNTTNTQTSAATLYDPRTIGVVVSAHL